MKNLFTKLSLKKRFLIIGVVFVSFSIYQIISDSFSKLIDLNSNYVQQSSSLKDIRELQNLMVSIQKMRGLTNLYLHNKEFDYDHIRKVQMRLQIELERLLFLEKNKDNAYLLNELELITKEINKLALLGGSNASSIFYNYTIVIDRLIAIIHNISSNIYLEKETPKSSRLLFDLLLNELPFIMENLGSARGITAGNLAVNAKQKNEDISLFKQLILSDIKKINLKLTALSHVKDTVSDDVRNDIKNLKHISKEYLTLLNTQQNIEAKNNSYTFYQFSTKLIDQYHHIYKKLFKALSSNLTEYYDTKRVELKIKIAAEIFVFFVTLILFIYFYSTSLRYVNRIKKAEKAKSLFLSNMSHEIRTPLNAIIGFIKLLQQTDDKTKSQHYAEIIDKSSQQLMHIINDILDFSKIEEKQVNLEIVPFNLKQEMFHLQNLFEANAQEKEINLELNIEDKVPECIKSDPFRLKQIISNLLSNAIKFTPSKGTVSLNLKMKRKQLEIAVNDTGLGIAKEHQKKIFKTFSQADETTTRKYGGTGLGLAICSNLVELFGSKLKVESEKGNGSKFYFKLNVEACSNEVPQQEEQNSNLELEGNVLVVEDNLTNQFLMQTTLESFGLRVQIANDGIEAVNMVKTNTYDLIFMDENMPNLNGIEATKQIVSYQKENNRTSSIIVALTANAKADEQQRFFDAGMKEYLAKPFEHEALYAILKKFLHNKPFY